MKPGTRVPSRRRPIGAAPAACLGAVVRGLAVALVAALLAVPVGAMRAVPTYGAVDGGPSVLMSNADGSNPYGSVVRYLGRAQCTGFFLQTFDPGDDSRDAPAYVVTNGHCPAFPGPHEILIDRPAMVGERVVFNYFADTVRQQVFVDVKKVAYATMKGEDLAVLELTATYDELLRAGFEPWPVTLTVPGPDEPAVIVGAPLRLEESTAYLRVMSCAIEDRVATVIEYIWYWFDYRRNRCSEVSGGSSGSPAISTRTGRVLGLVSTTTLGAAPDSDCFLNAPCEATAGGAVSQPLTSYITPVVRLDRCFDASGHFDVEAGGCPLAPAATLETTPAFVGAENPSRPASLLGQPRRAWDVTIGGRSAFYRYKIVDAATGDCRDLRGYGRPVRVLDQPLVSDPMPTVDGVYLLCLLGGNRADPGAGWQSADHPTAVWARIDTVAPRLTPLIRIDDEEDSWRFTFDVLDPELSGYLIKVGRAGSTRCDEPSGYRRLLVPFQSFSKAERPLTFCAIPYDAAQNMGPPFERLLP